VNKYFLSSFDRFRQRRIARIRKERESEVEGLRGIIADRTIIASGEIVVPVGPLRRPELVQQEEKATSLNV
jgi:hypothetical protein